MKLFLGHNFILPLMILRFPLHAYMRVPVQWGHFLQHRLVQVDDSATCIPESFFFLLYSNYILDLS